MTLYPKPPKTPRKPRRRIARGTKPIARKSRPRKQRKTPRAKLIRELDALVGDAVRERDGGCCTICGEPAGEGRKHDWAHLFSRSYWPVRWDWRNSTTLCRRHHYTYTRRPAEWFALVERRMGRERFERLRDVAFSRVKVDLERTLEYVRLGPQGEKPW